MKYIDAPDLKKRMIEIVEILAMDHVDLNRVECLRSYGSSTRRTIARCHALGKLMQRAMKTKAFYAIEFLEIFEKMNMDEQDKVIIHELMHIPKTFGGGFRQHDFVCEENVDILFEQYLKAKRRKENNFAGSREVKEKEKEKETKAFNPMEETKEHKGLLSWWS